VVFSKWQIFIFSLVPLALVFTGVIIGSVHGIDSEKEEFVAPPPAGSRPTPAAPSVPGATVLQIRAVNLLFDKRTLTAAANAPVTVQFDNSDAGVLHNVAFYQTSQAAQRIFVGDLFAGPEVRNYQFNAPAAGTYFFRCDVHPDTMTGTFTVR
jgi:plastocyanin